MRKYAWPILLTTLTLLALLLVYVDLHSPLRPLITFAFLLLCPGMAFVRLLRIDHIITEFTIAVASSLAIGQLVSMMVLYLGIWSTQANILLLSLVCFAGVGFQLVQLSVMPKPAADEEING